MTRPEASTEDTGEEGYEGGYKEDIPHVCECGFPEQSSERGEVEVGLINLFISVGRGEVSGAR